MLSAAFNSIVDFEDVSDRPQNYKDVLGHKSNRVWKIVPLSVMPHGRG
jgi:hypothetical protein